MLSALLAFHAPISDAFFSGAWATLQFRDSQIAERVMIKMLDENVTALPIHDSFIVRRGAEPMLDRAMKEAFREVVGIDALVDADTSLYANPTNDDPGLVFGKDLHDAMKDHMVSHSMYIRREYEWREVRGLGGID
jgi:hypothetical protein